MIQFIIIILGAAVLGIIFYRRAYILDKGISPFESPKKRQKNLFHFPTFRQEKSNFEVTVEDMIPSQDTIDAKNVTKAELFKRKGDMALEKGDIQNAEKLLIQALSLDPSNQDSYHKLGLIYLRQKQFGRAEMMYRKLIVTGFNEPTYLSNLGLSLYQQKKLEEAKTFYQKALETDQTRPGRFFSMAQIFYELQEFEHAIAHFRKAIELEPDNLDYLLSLAHFYVERDMKEEAKKLLGEILAMFPKNEEANEMMSKVQGGGLKEATEKL